MPAPATAHCPQCGAESVSGAKFCFRCGHALARQDGTRSGREHTYALHPHEHVTQLALISTLMPHSTRHVADHYRWALIVGGAVMLMLTVLGILPGAIVAAAALVPAVYLLYLYDAGVWEHAPEVLVLLLFGLTGILAALISALFFRGIWSGVFGDLLISGHGGVQVLSIGALALFTVALPLVAEVTKNATALVLTTRPRYADAIDGFTFGVASGTAYAAFETVVAFTPVFVSGHLHSTTALGSWVFVILNVGLIKPLLYGTATGTAIASFGAGGRRRWRPYLFNAGIAVIANVAYWLGLRLLGSTPYGPVLGLLWGGLLAAVMLIRARSVLHHAVLDDAAVAADSGDRPPHAARENAVCPECGTPLLTGATFCSECGVSVRATTAAGRRSITGSPAASS